MEKWGNLLTLLEHCHVSVGYFVVFSDGPEVLLVVGVFNDIHGKARRDLQNYLMESNNGSRWV